MQMHEFIEQAQSRVQILRQRADELEHSIQLIRNVQKELEAPVEEEPFSTSSVASEVPSRGTEILAAVFLVLEEHRNRPTSARVLYDRIRQKGIVVGGSERHRNLNTLLSREAAKPGSRLKSNGRGKGYQLREEPKNPI